MSVVSEAYDILFLFFAHVGFIDLLLDKQELVRNKVLKANSLCGNDTMDVSVRRQFEGKIFSFRKKCEPFLSQAGRPSQHLQSILAATLLQEKHIDNIFLCC